MIRTGPMRSRSLSALSLPVSAPFHSLTLNLFQSIEGSNRNDTYVTRLHGWYLSYLAKKAIANYLVRLLSIDEAKIFQAPGLR